MKHGRTTLVLRSPDRLVARLRLAALELAAPRSVALCLLASTLCLPGDAEARQRAGPPEWNADRVLELIDRARALRQSNAADPDLRSYAAEARGYVYFFFDRPGSTERVLVKADQVALDVWWRAPGLTRQTIKGRRDEELLPTEIRYHLDHLTVIQDDFGDLIRLGDGDEVASVLHPTAPGAEAVYDFALHDSLTISYAAGTEQIRVYEVRVRPRDLDRPGFVGSLYLDRDRAAIVRMSFSFTPASYVDPFLDYIRVSLDNSLWMGRWWLPWHQEIEIRREQPFLDISAGSVIRGRYDIRDYDFETELPVEAFRGRTVRAASPAEQAAFPFERGLFDDLEASERLGTPPPIAEVEEQVSEIAGDHVMSGLRPIRLHASRISDFARYDRAEGLFLGAGITLQPLPRLSVRTTAGYAFGRKGASASMRVGPAAASATGWTPSLRLSYDVLEDMGGHPGATLLENTITSAAGSQDYLDPYLVRGAGVVLRRAGASELTLRVRLEEHTSARDVVSDSPDTDFRPVRSVTEGVLGGASVAGRLALPAQGDLRLEGSVGRLGDRSFAKLDAAASWPLGNRREGWFGEASLTGGVVSRGAPAQEAYLLGGRHTLLGHEYRLFAGRAYWLARGEVTVPFRPPWLGIRGFAAVGSTHLGGWSLPADWSARDSNGLRGTVGLGLSLGWDALRFDVGRAVWGTGWEAIVSIAPDFRAWM